MEKPADTGKPIVSIIGFGEFGRLLVQYLSEDCTVYVAGRNRITQTYGLNFKEVDMKTALAQKIIIPAIPAQMLDEFFVKNKKFINPESLFIDVCSVKILPVKLMLLHLPKTCQIIATHPMFGPVSAADGLKGHRIMMHPVRVDKKLYDQAKTYVRDKFGLKIIETTPEQHDKAMAYVQGLSHYIGRVMQLMRIPETELSTLAYEDLVGMKKVQGNDSWELFESIMFENPYSVDVHMRFKLAMQKLDDRLGLHQKDDK